MVNGGSKQVLQHVNNDMIPEDFKLEATSGVHRTFSKQSLGYSSVKGSPA
jgi:hypothetical protein